MKAKILFQLLIFFSCNLFYSQSRSLYIIDSIPLIERLSDKDNKIGQDNIAKIEISTDKKIISNYNIKGLDSLIFITTKSYLNRDDSLKQIPSTKTMINKDNGVWYCKGQRYSGPFLDYYYNGKLKNEGRMLNGKIHGRLNVYFNNGVLSNELYFDKGIKVNRHLEYHKNGNLKLKSYYNNGVRIGTWEAYAFKGYLNKKYSFKKGKRDITTEYYSTGKTKRTFKNLNDIFLDSKFLNHRIYFFKAKTEMIDYSFYHGNKKYLESKDYNKTIKYINKLIKRNPGIDDYYLFRSFLFYINHDYDLAIKDLEKARSLEPTNNNIINLISIAAIRQLETNKKYKLKDEVVNFICEKLSNNIHEIEINFESLSINKFENLCNQ